VEKDEVVVGGGWGVFFFGLFPALEKKKEKGPSGMRGERITGGRKKRKKKEPSLDI